MMVAEQPAAWRQFLEGARGMVREGSALEVRGTLRHERIPVGGAMGGGTGWRQGYGDGRMILRVMLPASRPVVVIGMELLLGSKGAAPGIGAGTLSNRGNGYKPFSNRALMSFIATTNASRNARIGTRRGKIERFMPPPVRIHFRVESIEALGEGFSSI